MTTRTFTIDADIARASLPPAELYRDPDWLPVQRDRVFARSWHAILDERTPSAKGDVLPFSLAPDLLDEPLLMTRDGEGVLRCLSNVCTHRGNLLVTEPARLSALRCSYHGRCFDLAGRCERTFTIAGEEPIAPRDEDDLGEIAVAELGPLPFAALAPAMRFGELTRPVRERTDFLDWSSMKEDEGSRRDYEVDANWVLYVDNYLEGLHVPHVHPALARSLDMTDYRIETFDWSSVQVATAQADEDAFDPPAGHPDHGRRIAAWYFWLFPATTLNFYPWGLSLNVITPIAHDLTRVSYRAWVVDESKRQRGAGADLERIEQEDEDIVARCQVGMGSRVLSRGAYEPKHEVAVHHWHRLLARYLRAPGE